MSSKKLINVFIWLTKFNQLLNDSSEQSIHEMSLEGKDFWDQQIIIYLLFIKRKHIQPLYDADIVLVIEMNPLYFG